MSTKDKYGHAEIPMRWEVSSMDLAIATTQPMKVPVLLT